MSELWDLNHVSFRAEFLIGKLYFDDTHNGFFLMMKNFVVIVGVTSLE